VSIPLDRLEEIIDNSRVAGRIEMLLPAGVRPRQPKVRTLLTGMLITQADHRPAHLTRMHEALTALSADDQVRLGVIAEWKTGPHQLTYRQAERTCRLVTRALKKDQPDGVPSQLLTRILDDLLEASIPPDHQDTSAALAVEERPGDLLLPAASRHQRLRRPRGVLGAPHRRRRPRQRAVLRLLPLGSHHDVRRTRAGGPRAGPADDAFLLPRRPGPGPRPGPAADLCQRHPAR
jgi:hypothetical protein